MLRHRTIAALSAAAIVAAAGSASGQDSGGWADEDGYYGDQGIPAAEGSVGIETFQGSLAPYGQWVVSPTYGQVWRPHTAPGWRPYYYGRWEWTDEGWLWVSDEPYGWAVYHYGRWAWDPGWGWIWVPGYQWAPAWVSWRYSGEVIGWAPLGPGFSVYVTSYPFYDYWWTFVPTVRFVGTPVYRIAYAPSFTRRWYDSTAPAPPRARPAGPLRPVPSGATAAAPAWGGPAPRFLQERTGRAVTPVRIAPAAHPGAVASRPGSVPVYRPDLAGGREHGRGPGAVSPPGQVRGPREHGRGTGPVPAPGQVRGQGGRPAIAPGPAWSDDGDGGRGEQRGEQRATGQGGQPAHRGGGYAPRGGSAPAPAAPSRGSAPPARGGGGGGQRQR
jgi:hypothetical protein